MALPALVLVHGGGLAADSWELTVEEIHRLAPELTVVALDMPGRRNKPGDLREMAIADCVDSLVGDIESAGLERHRHRRALDGGSAAARSGHQAWSGAGARNDLRRRLPPSGRHVDRGKLTVGGQDDRPVQSKEKRANANAEVVFRLVFLNGVPSHRRRFMEGKLYAESLRMLIEKVSRRGMPDDIPRTWILTHCGIVPSRRTCSSNTLTRSVVCRHLSKSTLVTWLWSVSRNGSPRFSLTAVGCTSSRDSRLRRLPNTRRAPIRRRQCRP